MLEEGIVSKAKNGKITISIARRAACSNCKACSKGNNKSMPIELENSINAQVGDKVLLHLDDRIILKGAIFAYLVPLILLLCGLFIGNFVAGFVGLVKFKELISFVFGIMFLALTFFGIRRFGFINREKFKPTVTLQK